MLLSRGSPGHAPFTSTTEGISARAPALIVTGMCRLNARACACWEGEDGVEGGEL